MSLEVEQQRTLEDLYEQLTSCVDLSEWKEARDLIVFAIEQEYHPLAKSMQDYYNENRCEDCLGTGKIIEGNFDNQIEKDCVCQLKN